MRARKVGSLFTLIVSLFAASLAFAPIPVRAQEIQDTGVQNGVGYFSHPQSVFLQCRYGTGYAPTIQTSPGGDYWIRALCPDTGPAPNQVSFGGWFGNSLIVYIEGGSFTMYPNGGHYVGNYYVSGPRLQVYFNNRCQLNTRLTQGGVTSDCYVATSTFQPERVTAYKCADGSIPKLKWNTQSQVMMSCGPTAHNDGIFESPRDPNGMFKYVMDSHTVSHIQGYNVGVYSCTSSPPYNSPMLCVKTRAS